MSDLTNAFHWDAEKSASKSTVIKGLFTSLVREIQIRRAMREVSTLDDAALTDMGISRGGIEDAVRCGRH